MEVETLLEFADRLFFEKHGKHLNDLQVEVIKGAIARRKYAAIAQDYHCTEGHVKDVAYELWQILSEFLGEEVNKSNLRATLERKGILNSWTNFVFGDFGNCNSIGTIEIDRTEDRYTNQKQRKELDRFQKGKEEAKREAIPKLREIGLTPEQIARALDLPDDAVESM